MKTKEIPAIIMLLAGALYCLLGIYYQTPLMDFLVQLLIVLLAFWIIGGILRMILDHFLVKLQNNKKEDDEEDSVETNAITIEEEIAEEY